MNPTLAYFIGTYCICFFIAFFVRIANSKKEDPFTHDIAIMIVFGLILEILPAGIWFILYHIRHT